MSARSDTAALEATHGPDQARYRSFYLPVWAAAVVSTLLWYAVTRSLFVTLFSALFATLPAPPNRRTWVAAAGTLVPGALALLLRRFVERP